jgi:hypothetical protein
MLSSAWCGCPHGRMGTLRQRNWKIEACSHASCAAISVCRANLFLTVVQIEYAPPRLATAARSDE